MGSISFTIRKILPCLFETNTAFGSTMLTNQLSLVGSLRAAENLAWYEQQRLEDGQQCRGHSSSDAQSASVERPILTLLTQRNKIKVEAPRATPPFIFPGTGEAVSGERKKDIGNTFQTFNIEHGPFLRWFTSECMTFQCANHSLTREVT